MTLDEFRESLSASAPPDGLAPALHALWHDGRGDWETAHAIAQDADDETGAWVHAYLHRKEGDLGNAGYWYRRARKPASHAPLGREWAEIVATRLA
jgi:hypothetical protein